MRYGAHASLLLNYLLPFTTRDQPSSRNRGRNDPINMLTRYMHAASVYSPSLDHLFSARHDLLLALQLFLFLQLAFLADVQDDDRPPHLDALLLLADQFDVHLLLFEKGAKLGFVVEDREVIAVELQEGVVAGDGNVGYADLAFVASAELDTAFRYVLYHHHALRFLAGALQDQVAALRLLNRKQLHVLTGKQLDYDRQFRLAHLALKLLEVVVQRASDDLLLDFYPNPLQQAVDVDGPAGTRALAGVEEEVVGFLGFVQADLAGALLDLFLIVGVVFEYQLVGVQLLLVGFSRYHVLAYADLADIEFHPAKFYGLPGIQINICVLSLQPLGYPVGSFCLRTIMYVSSSLRVTLKMDYSVLRRSLLIFLRGFSEQLNKFNRNLLLLRLFMSNLVRNWYSSGSNLPSWVWSSATTLQAALFIPLHSRFLQRATLFVVARGKTKALVLIFADSQSKRECESLYQVTDFKQSIQLFLSFATSIFYIYYNQLQYALTSPYI